MGLTLVLGATGKTGSRVADRLTKLGVPVRKGSRSAVPAFDWGVESGWDACLEGVEAVYINYAARSCHSRRHRFDPGFR